MRGGDDEWIPVQCVARERVRWTAEHGFCCTAIETSGREQLVRGDFAFRFREGSLIS